METVRTEIATLGRDRRQVGPGNALLRRLTWAIVGATSMLVVTACGSAVVNGQAATEDRSIVGTWVVNVTPNAPVPAFQSIIVFTRDGAVIEGTSKPFAAPVADTSEGLGVWSNAGDSVHMTFEKYLFDSQGHYAGRTIVTETDTLSNHGTEYAGTASTTIYGANGNTIATFTSSSQAQRMAS